MANKTELRTYRHALLCVALFVVSVIAPRFVPHQEGGFASAASATLLFLAMLLGVCIFSLFLLARTVRDFHAISTPARIAGIAPGLILVAGLGMLLVFLRY